MATLSTINWKFSNLLCLGNPAGNEIKVKVGLTSIDGKSFFFVAKMVNWTGNFIDFTPINPYLFSIIPPKVVSHYQPHDFLS